MLPIPPPRMSRAGFSFLLAEIGFGLTLTQIAGSLNANEHAKVARLIRKARTAYEEVLRFRSRLEFDDGAAAADLETGLIRLRTALQGFGEPV